MDVIYFLRIAQQFPKSVEQSDIHEEPNAIVLLVDIYAKSKKKYPTDIRHFSVRVA